MATVASGQNITMCHLCCVLDAESRRASRPRYRLAELPRATVEAQSLSPLHTLTLETHTVHISHTVEINSSTF
jgi:hypothetical protein